MHKDIGDVITDISKDQEFCRRQVLRQSAGEIIYPGELAQKTILKMIAVYEVLEKLKDEEYLQMILSPVCHKCGGRTDEYLETIHDFKDGRCCNVCKTPLTMEDLVVLYRVKEKEK